MAVMTWGTYKETIRRSILKDATGLVATDDRLLDAARWAFDELCPHTAYQKTTTYVGDGSTYQFTLPDDVYYPIDQYGLVMVFDEPTQLVSYLQPAYSTFNVAPSDDGAFSVWPADTLETGVPPPTSTTLIVRYYAHYPYMVADNDLMPIPLWSYAAVAYSIGVHLMTSRSWEEAENATDKTKPDAGQPENNSLRQLQKWWIQMNREELARHPAQVKLSSPRDLRDPRGLR